MAEVKQHYNDMVERQTWVKVWEDQKYRMLTDNFDDPNWKHGNPIVGTMTFTDVMPPTIMQEPVRDLAAELTELKEWAKTKGFIEVVE